MQRELECLHAQRLRAEAQTAAALRQRRVAESARRKQVEQERQTAEAQRQEVANASCRRSTRFRLIASDISECVTLRHRVEVLEAELKKQQSRYAADRSKVESVAEAWNKAATQKSQFEAQTKAAKEERARGIGPSSLVLQSS